MEIALNLRPLHEVGDWATVKTLEALTRELGDPTRAQSGWVPNAMDRYAGGTYKVFKRTISTNHGIHYSYQLQGAGYWWFSEDTLESPTDQCVNINMSFDDLLEGM